VSLQGNAAFMEWVALNGKRYPDLARIYHVPSSFGGGRFARDLIHRVSGVRSGVLSYVLDVPLHGLHGLRIELVDGGGGVLDEKIEEVKFLRSRGYAACFAFGWEAAVLAVGCYYSAWCDDFPLGDALPLRNVPVVMCSRGLADGPVVREICRLFACEPWLTKAAVSLRRKRVTSSD
jgi:hypothetical protein